jgi:hypothetical protein
MRRRRRFFRRKSTRRDDKISSVQLFRIKSSSNFYTSLVTRLALIVFHFLRHVRRPNEQQEEDDKFDKFLWEIKKLSCENVFLTSVCTVSEDEERHGDDLRFFEAWRREKRVGNESKHEIKWRLWLSRLSDRACMIEFCL